MHTIQTHHLLCDLVGAETASKLGRERQTALLKSFGTGAAALAIVAFAGCQQFAGKTGKASVAPPAIAAYVIVDAHDSLWISRAHAVAFRSGSDLAVPDLSHQASADLVGAVREHRQSLNRSP